jgi:hypothetical protein
MPEGPAPLFDHLLQPSLDRYQDRRAPEFRTRQFIPAAEQPRIIHRSRRTAIQICRPCRFSRYASIVANCQFPAYHSLLRADVMAHSTRYSPGNIRCSCGCGMRLRWTRRVEDLLSDLRMTHPNGIGFSRSMY